MSQTSEGAAKVIAKKAGLSFEEYKRRSATEKYCWRCKRMHLRTEFAVDRSRSDGLASACKVSVSVDSRGRYTPSTKSRLRGWLVPTRDGDKKQARRRVNYLVEQGRIPPPNDLPCVDCADELGFNSARHEYDHAKGYDGENQLYVEPVCTTCHNNREEARRG